MSTSRFLTKVATVMTVLIITLSSVQPVFAAAPANDNFDFATVIDPSALPYSDSVDNTEATTEPDEPQYCYYSPQTVWYSFTPSASGVFRADMAASSFGDTILNVYQATGSGFGGLSFLQCAAFGGSITFSAQAGTTYYIQAGNIYYGSGGNLHLNLQQIPPPANDNFDNATVIPALPFDDTVDTVASSIEPGEPTASCAFNGSSSTVWYAFTSPITGSVSASSPIISFTPVVAAYTGNSLASLTEVGCRQYGNLLTLHVETGTTYYFQAGSFYPWASGGLMQFHLEVTPPPVANFYFYPSDPSVFDTIQFCDNSFDPGQVGFESFTWDFGDGATSTGGCAAHEYSADGDYTVQHGVTTVDGRSASTSQVVQVRTHDVAIAKVSAPLSANVGQTRPIIIYISNKRYGETVQVSLYKSVPGGFQFVGSYTQFVPVRSGNRTTAFTFNYTFTSDDGNVGKVTFKAVASIISARDAFPADNEAISSPPTKVTR